MFPSCYPELNEIQTTSRDTIRKAVERELGGGTTEIQELTIARNLVSQASA